MLLHSLDCSTTLDPYLIMLSALSKAASSTIFWVFGMTWPGIELQSLRPLVNTLLIKPMAWSKRNIHKNKYFLCRISTNLITTIRFLFEEQEFDRTELIGCNYFLIINIFRIIKNRQNIILSLNPHYHYLLYPQFTWIFFT